MSIKRPFVVYVLLTAIINLCDAATPEFQAYQEYSMRVWKAAVENKYRSIGKSVDWFLRLESPQEPNYVNSSVDGFLKPGRFGECEVIVISPKLAYIGGWDSMQNAVDPLDFSSKSVGELLKAGDWIHLVGLVYKADSDSVTIVATAVTNLGRRTDLEWHFEMSVVY